MTTGKIEVTAHNHGFAVDAPIGETVRPRTVTAGTARVFVSHIDLNDDVSKACSASHPRVLRAIQHAI